MIYVYSILLILMPLHFHFCANMPAVTSSFWSGKKPWFNIWINYVKQWKYIYIWSSWWNHPKIMVHWLGWLKKWALKPPSSLCTPPARLCFSGGFQEVCGDVDEVDWEKMGPGKWWVFFDLCFLCFLNLTWVPENQWLEDEISVLGIIMDNLFF